MSVVARELGFAYPDGSELFAGLDLTIEPGQVVALTGPSGRGKSTLLYLCGLLLRPTAGNIEVLGIRTDSLSDRARSWLRADRMGFVFQDAALDPTRTVFDNVTEGAVYRGTRRRALATRALELLDRFEVRVPADARPTQVSGGQAARIGLCRALLASPAVLLADEPTGNLDAASAGLVLRALQQAAADGATVVIATHDATVVGRCDDVVDLGAAA